MIVEVSEQSYFKDPGRWLDCVDHGMELVVRDAHGRVRMVVSGSRESSDTRENMDETRFQRQLNTLIKSKLDASKSNLHTLLNGFARELRSPFVQSETALTEEESNLISSAVDQIFNAAVAQALGCIMGPLCFAAEGLAEALNAESFLKDVESGSW